MSTGQNYPGKGDSTTPIEPTATPPPQTAASKDNWQARFTDASDALADYLRYVDNCHQARLILRSWFMAHTMVENDTTSSVSSAYGPVENIYLYELLDDMISDLLLKNRIARATVIENEVQEGQDRD